MANKSQCTQAALLSFEPRRCACWHNREKIPSSQWSTHLPYHKTEDVGTCMSSAEECRLVTLGKKVPEDKWLYYMCRGCGASCAHVKDGFSRENKVGIRCCGPQWNFIRACWTNGKDFWVDGLPCIRPEPDDKPPPSGGGGKGGGKGSHYPQSGDGSQGNKSYSNQSGNYGNGGWNGSGGWSSNNWSGGGWSNDHSSHGRPGQWTGGKYNVYYPHSSLDTTSSSAAEAQPTRQVTTGPNTIPVAARVHSDSLEQEHLKKVNTKITPEPESTEKPLEALTTDCKEAEVDEGASKGADEPLEPKCCINHGKISPHAVLDSTRAATLEEAKKDPRFIAYHIEKRKERLAAEALKVSEETTATSSKIASDDAEKPAPTSDEEGVKVKGDEVAEKKQLTKTCSNGTGESSKNNVETAEADNISTISSRASMITPPPPQGEEAGASSQKSRSRSCSSKSRSSSKRSCSKSSSSSRSSSRRSSSKSRRSDSQDQKISSPEAKRGKKSNETSPGGTISTPGGSDKSQPASNRDSSSAKEATPAVTQAPQAPVSQQQTPQRPVQTNEASQTPNQPRFIVMVQQPDGSWQPLQVQQPAQAPAGPPVLINMGNQGTISAGIAPTHGGEYMFHSNGTTTWQEQSQNFHSPVYDNSIGGNQW